MKIGIARIYYGGGRRWFTLRAACNAEARTVINERRRRDGDDERNHERTAERVKRLALRLEREHQRNTP